MSNVNFSELSSVSIIDADAQICVRLSNALSGADGFAKITRTGIEKSLGVFTTVQAGSASWNTAYTTSVSNQVAIVDETAARVLADSNLSTSITNEISARIAADALKADLINGFIPSSQIPAIAISTYLGAVSSQALMLDLSGQSGDWCNRTDTSTAWVVWGTTSEQLSSWAQINYPAPIVTSVNGQAGVIVLGKADIGLANCDNTSDADKPLSTVQLSALNLKQNVSSLSASVASVVRLDSLLSPTDVTTLNATTSAHGLLPKLGGGTTNFLRADGSWAAPAGGSSALTPTIAYVASNGNDGTGTVGDPSKPFLTAQAAFDAAKVGGVACLNIGVGSFGDITSTGAFQLYLIGCGSKLSYIGNIVITSGAAFNIFSTSSSSITINGISGRGANGINGTPGGDGSGAPYPTPGENGDGFGSVCVIQGVTVTNSINMYGGNGGNGAFGGNMSGGPIPYDGSYGGSGAVGPYIDVIDSIISGYVNSFGGNGGDGGSGGNDLDNGFPGGTGGAAGNGRAGGLVNIIRSKVVGFSAVSGAAGTPGVGGTGATTGVTGAIGSTEGPGSIQTMFAESDTNATNSETTLFRASWINGSFVTG